MHSLCPLSGELFSWMGAEFCQKLFTASIKMIKLFLFFSLLMWCITLTNMWMLKNRCILGINPTWSWCMIFLMYCWIWMASILLRIFASMFKNDGRNRTQINLKNTMGKKEVSKRTLLKVLLNLPSHLIWSVFLYLKKKRSKRFPFR